MDSPIALRSSSSSEHETISMDSKLFEPMEVKDAHEDEHSALVKKPSWLRIQLESMVSSPLATVFNNPYTVTGLAAAGTWIVTGMVQSSTSVSAIELGIEVGTLIFLGVMLAGSVVVYQADRYFTGEKMQYWKDRAQIQDSKRVALKKTVRELKVLIKGLDGDHDDLENKINELDQQMKDQILFEIRSPVIRRLDDFYDGDFSDTDSTGSTNDGYSSNGKNGDDIFLSPGYRKAVKKKMDTTGSDIINAETETTTQTTTQTTTPPGLTAASQMKSRSTTVSSDNF